MGSWRWKGMLAAAIALPALRDRADFSGNHKSFTFSTKGKPMKSAGLWTMKIGLVICLGISAVEQGNADEREHATTCSLATLKGRYLFATSGMIFPPAVTQPVVFARAGYRIFNGDGTGTVIATTSENGVIVDADAQQTLTYTMNKNCTGTYTRLPGTTPSVEIFVAPNGEELVVIETVNGRSDDAHSSRRVGPE